MLGRELAAGAPVCGGRCGGEDASGGKPVRLARGGAGRSAEGAAAAPAVEIGLAGRVFAGSLGGTVRRIIALVVLLLLKLA